jgi:hypothetical protein
LAAGKEVEVKLKSFGLTVAMTLALTAFVGVSSASAANFFAPHIGATTWNGAREGENHVLTLGSEVYGGCSKVSFTGVTLESEPEPTSLTVSPETFVCSFLGQPFFIQSGGCELRFNFGSGEFPVGTMDIVDCTTAITMGYQGCETTIGEQENLGTVTYSKTTEGGLPVIKATANLSGIKYTRTGFGCFGGNPGTYTNGKYKGTWTIKGEKLPVSITGKRAGSKLAVFEVSGNGYLSCKVHVLATKTPAVAKFASMTVTPSYDECTFYAQPVTMSMGGCHFVLHASGGFDIAGALCASKPITFGMEGCTVTIGPSSGGTGIFYTNSGSGTSSTVTTDSAGKTGLLASVSGPICISPGTKNTNYRAVDVFTATPGGLSVE